ncbi:cation:proton antiporter [Rhizorhabdus argentea]|uniref:cation:proton antiporter n=1 Tax=Rhizorhabdus argentea TaxID=1387174 RepID=UPI0030EF1125
MTERPIVGLGLILLVASLVAIISRRFRLPYSVGLVTAGIALAFGPYKLDLRLSRDLIFMVFLPPLVFEAALQLKWKHFCRNLPVTLLLAFPGVVIAAAIVAVGTHLLLGWSWMGSSLFGVLIAATDPVSVIAAFKEMQIDRRLSMLVESESLLNDGSAAVGFGMLVSIAAGAEATPLAIGGSLFWTVIGGILFGALVAGLLLLVAGRTEDHMVEITLTTIAAYGSFLLADHFEMSGVLASLTAGLLIGNMGWRGPISENGREHVKAFWEYAAFLANSIVFILIGGHEVQQPLSAYGPAAVLAIALVLMGRAAAIYPLCALVARANHPMDMRYRHVLFWGGLRGALALALALALPAALPERQEIIVVAFAVVAFSIFAQGLTMPWLVRRLGLMKAD